MGLDSAENRIDLIISKYGKELILRNHQIEREIIMKKIISTIVPLATGLVVGVVVGRAN